MREKVFYLVEFSEVRVGDKLSVLYAGDLYADIKVKDKEFSTISGERFAFSSSWDCTYFLIERPKTLPTKLGAVIESDGVEWVLCDPQNAAPWYSPDNMDFRTNEDFASRVWEEVV